MFTEICTYDTTRLDCFLRVYIDGDFGVMICIIKLCKSKKKGKFISNTKSVKFNSSVQYLTTIFD